MLARGVEAFAGLGIEARGFRPPGGELNARTPALLRAAGLQLVLAGRRDRRRSPRSGLRPVWLGPRRCLSPDGQLRRAAGSRGDPESALEPGELADRWEEELADLANTGSLRTMVLHPFLMLDERWAGGVSRLFAFMAALARERRTWVVAGGVFADWLMTKAPRSRPRTAALAS